MNMRYTDKGGGTITNADTIRRLMGTNSKLAELLVSVMFIQMPYADDLPDQVDMNQAREIIQRWLSEEQK